MLKSVLDMFFSPAVVIIFQKCALAQFRHVLKSSCLLSIQTCALAQLFTIVSNLGQTNSDVCFSPAVVIIFQTYTLAQFRHVLY